MTGDHERPAVTTGQLAHHQLQELEEVQPVMVTAQQENGLAPGEPVAKAFEELARHIGWHTSGAVSEHVTRYQQQVYSVLLAQAQHFVQHSKLVGQAPVPAPNSPQV